MMSLFSFFFTDTATTEIYTLSLHDALPILSDHDERPEGVDLIVSKPITLGSTRSEEHTSELQSLTNLVCRLLLEKKKKAQRGADIFKKGTKERGVVTQK